MEAPPYPAGEHAPGDPLDASRREGLLEEIRKAPPRVRSAVRGLSDGQLDTRYRNWTIRQIVHHLADSHINAYVRFKWALTEDAPTIKAYDEGLWADLEDSRSGAVAPVLSLLHGLHGRWLVLLRSMSADQFARTFHHPETGRTVILGAMLDYYAWHGRHHTGQILWLRSHHGW